MSFKKLVVQSITSVPIASDFYLYYWRFPRNITACRGVFSSFSEAKAALPTGASFGYNQSAIERNSNVAKLTANRSLGELEAFDRLLLGPLTSALKDSSSIFDLGGNVGVSYFAFQKHVNYPENLTWLVGEIPEIVKAGEKLAQETNARNLSFTTEFSRADGIDILLTCGTLQYIEPSLAEMLEGLNKKPKHVLVNHVPFYEGEEFVTLQNIGYAFTPYKIQNRSQFINSLTEQNYQLVDSWELPRACVIPFDRKRTVRAYRGFYFKQS